MPSMHQSNTNPNTAPAKVTTTAATAGFVTLADIKKQQQQGNNNDIKQLSDDPDIQIRHVKHAKIDIRQVNPNKQRHSEQARVENPSPPLPTQTQTKSKELPLSLSSAPQRRQRVLENQVQRQQQRQQHHHHQQQHDRKPPVTKHKQQPPAPANAPTSGGGISKLCDKIKVAAQIVRENYNAGIDAAAALDTKSNSHHHHHTPETKRDRKPAKQPTMKNPLSPSQPSRNTTTPQKTRDAIRARLESTNHRIPPESLLCAICHRHGAVFYPETPDKPLCKRCFSLGFVPPLPSTRNPTIPAPLRIDKRGQDRCTLLPTQEDLARQTTPPTLHPPPRAAEHRINPQTSTTSSPRRPNLRVNTSINQEYAPASWRAGKANTKGGLLPPPAAPMTKVKAHRATVASVWDDDVPDMQHEAVPSVPAVPLVYQPRLPFLTPANPAAPKPAREEKRFDRSRSRSRYSPSVYSNREPSPTLEFGFQAVPEGRYENF